MAVRSKESYKTKMGICTSTKKKYVLRRNLTFEVIRHGTSCVNSEESCVHDRNFTAQCSQITTTFDRDYSPEEVKVPSGLLVQSPSAQHLKSIKKALDAHPILKSSSAKIKLNLINSASLYMVSPGKFTYKSNFIYIISAGLVKCKDEQTFKPGQIVGQFNDRDVFLQVVETCYVWIICKQVFALTIQETQRKKHKMISQLKNKVSLLQYFTDEQIQHIVDEMIEIHCEVGKVIVQEGDKGDLIYFIYKGSVKCTKNKLCFRTLHEGDYFGEQALIYDIPRTASVIANSHVHLIGVRKDVFGSSLKSVVCTNIIVNAFTNSEHFKHLRKEQMGKLAEKANIVKLKKDEVVDPDGLRKGIWVVISGDITDRKGNNYRVTGILGESEILKQRQFKAFSADSDCQLAYITDKLMVKTLGDRIDKVISINQVISVLRQVKLFSHLPHDKLTALASKLQEQTYPPHHFIFSEGTQSTDFFVIQSGKVNIMKEGLVIRSLERHGYFGQRSILKDKIRTATVKTVTSVTCWVLSADHFFQILDRQTISFLESRMYLEDDTIDLQNLYIANKIGSGGFGDVFLTVDSVSKNKYALKTVSKEKIQEMNMLKEINNERDILLQIDHPFIVSLVKTFNTPERIYFLMEFVEGIDLFSVLQKLKSLTERHSQFLISCILLMIRQLHDKNIVYRDFKPENFMIEFDGYPKLIDFGTCKQIKGKTHTFVGTSHFMAPEVISGKFYGLPADLWAVGVMLYQFIIGKLPFGDKENNPFKVFEIVLKGKVEFPQRLKDMPLAFDLVQKLLQLSPHARLDVENAIKHQWFADVQWEELITKTHQAPYTFMRNSVKPDIDEALREKQKIYKIMKKIVKTKASKRDWDFDF